MRVGSRACYCNEQRSTHCYFTQCKGCSYSF